MHLNFQFFLFWYWLVAHYTFFFQSISFSPFFFLILFLTLINFNFLLVGVVYYLRFLLNKTIDILLYVDRLDAYRVDNLDREVVKAITSTFGKGIWNRALVVLTHAQLSPPDGLPYDEFFTKRSEALLKALRLGAGLKKSDVQVHDHEALESLVCLSLSSFLYVLVLFFFFAGISMSWLFNCLNMWFILCCMKIFIYQDVI